MSSIHVLIDGTMRDFEDVDDVEIDYQDRVTAISFLMNGNKITTIVPCTAYVFIEEEDE